MYFIFNKQGKIFVVKLTVLSNKFGIFMGSGFSI